MDPNIQANQSPPNKVSSSLMLSVLALIIAVTVAVMMVAGEFSGTDSLQQQIDEQSDKLSEIELQQGFFVDEEVNLDTYQAVFLADGTVYFGQLSDGLPGQVKLENIYYLQDGEYGQGGEISSSGQLSLVKLGNEVHGPEDVMHISRDQMVFWENMKLDSQVMMAIVEYQSSL